jgi:poly-gamma-glutamate capsule biosynthesis protein CapA/YwtB (metallophosphatase superfamily)
VLLALAGDTMLGRGVAERLRSSAPQSLVAPEIVGFARRADRFVLNLECCISERGEPWPAAGKPFFFRAPPAAVDLLVHLGVDCVTLANNHALDFGDEAFEDTVRYLDGAGIAHAGAGGDVVAARTPATLHVGDATLRVLAFADHPADFAASEDRAGIAFADLRPGLPQWIADAVRASPAEVTLISPHWGPNMTDRPVEEVRLAARALVEAGATLVAGHSAHVVHAVEGWVLYDLGDFLDDYAVDRRLRNDLGLLWLVEIDGGGPRRLEALPLHLDFCRTRPATGEDAAWIGKRFREASAALGTHVTDEDGILVIEW